MMSAPTEEKAMPAESEAAKEPNTHSYSAATYSAAAELLAVTEA
jgi:hypothetical protein